MGRKKSRAWPSKNARTGNKKSRAQKTKKGRIARSKCTHGPAKARASPKKSARTQAKIPRTCRQNRAHIGGWGAQGVPGARAQQKKNGFFSKKWAFW
jgi:hypothetical protein